MLKVIVSGNLLDNVALHILLDVGTLLKQSTCHSMRYSQTSKDLAGSIETFSGERSEVFKGERTAGTSEGNNIHTVETRESVYPWD